MVGDVMLYTIKYNIDKEIIVEKSRFIVKLIKINDEQNISDILKKIKIEYKDADHYCYGYIINDIKRFNDDKEPNGTAGIPILETLVKNKLTNILCVIIRYFGGIKLGASRLGRTYGLAVREAIKISNLAIIIPSKKIVITFNYNDTKKIDYILNNIIIYDKKYDIDISYYCNIENDKLDEIKKELNLILNVEIIDLENSYIEKNK